MRHKEAEGGGGREGRGERSGAPSDATGSLHSLLPNKAKAGQAGEKMMPNCQQSQHLKSLPSLLNKDTFLICSSKLFFKVISRIWGEMLTFLSQFLFPTPIPLLICHGLDKGTCYFCSKPDSLTTSEIKKARLSPNISPAFFFFMATQRISLHFVAKEWINKKSFELSAPKGIKLFSVRGKSFGSISKAGKSCTIWNYNAVGP